MSTPITGLLHPALLNAMVETAKQAQDTATPFTTQEHAMTKDWQENLKAYLPLEELTPLSSPPLPSAPSPPPPPSPPPLSTQQTLASELRILNAELAICQMTHMALFTREALLKKRQAEIEKVLYSYSPTPEQDVSLTEEVQGQREDDGLYMRDVPRRSGAVNTNVKVANVKVKEEVVEKKPVVLGRKEAKRLALIELHRKTFGDCR
jgi:hypothetical protein